MYQQKMNIGILFGGKSAEHEVSLQSAKNIVDALDKTKYNPILIGIDKAGKWLLYDTSKFLIDVDDPKGIQLDQSSDLVVLLPQGSGKLLNYTNSHQDIKIDVIFPVLHGPFGEDGTVQGLLKIAHLPFVGASVLGSAVGMDKDVMKRLLRDAGLPVGKFIALKVHESIPSFHDMQHALGVPFFVKPANMGSSIGVQKIHNEAEYHQGLLQSFHFDTKVILEECIHGREIECAVLGNENPIASITGEIIAHNGFYSYDAKYIHADSAVLHIPANIPHDITKQIQKLAIQTFQTLSCECLGRVDFFLQHDGTIIINEINTMPGFTKISMYPKLWEASGISYTQLIDRLIELAIERFEKEQKLHTHSH